ncbi:MAG: hypothetical protein HWN68_07745 [Desulfobacterales bacterium]|nr:hypothetical protein [Desulfobacterales bacterium]
MNDNLKFMVALVLALVLDGVDFVGGFIPILGDVIDMFGIIILFSLIGVYALIGVAEFVPLVDFLPLFVGSVIAWKMDVLGRRGKGGW